MINYSKISVIEESITGRGMLHHSEKTTGNQNIDIQ